jgi:predicted dehydrogenase
MPHVTRRQFLKGTALAAAAVGFKRAAWAAGEAPAILSTASPNSKLGIACIGVGGRGEGHLGPASGENLIALCDVDRKAIDKALVKFPGAKTFSDYRKMFDAMEKEIDAVFVAIPDHSHAAASMLAIDAGKACYTEKPLTWSVQEARALAEAVARKKVASQMGNQGHANQGGRLIVEWIRDGAIGDVKEVHTWTNRPVWPQGITERPPTLPVPEGLDWDCWIGPAPFRDYHDGLHGFKWRGWLDFGCGAIGDMGCHTWDNVYWSMQPDYPTHLELLEVNGPGGKETFAKQTKFKWVFPAKGSRPGFDAYWYSGGLQPATPEEVLNDPSAKQGDKPPALPETGNLYIGTKGKLLVAGDYGDSPRLIPETSMQAFMEGRKGKVSPNKLEPSPGHHQEFLMAARGEKPWNFPKSNFAEYAGPLTEVMLLGAILEKIGQVGFKIECDPLRRKIKTPEAQALFGRHYRDGWKL